MILAHDFRNYIYKIMNISKNIKQNSFKLCMDSFGIVASKQ